MNSPTMVSGGIQNNITIILGIDIAPYFFKALYMYYLVVMLTTTLSGKYYPHIAGAGWAAKRQQLA